MTFGCNKATAEDLVQEMYIKIMRQLQKDTDIMFNKNEENYYYIYKTLYSLFIDLKRKESKIQFRPIEEIMHLQESEYVNFDEILTNVNSELERQFWYDKKVYEIIDNGESISELSRKTNISYYSLYNTYKKVKKILKQLL